MSRSLFISSFFDRGFFDEHHGDVVANRIDALALGALERAAVGLDLNVGFASGTGEYFQEFLTNCHRHDLSSGAGKVTKA